MKIKLDENLPARLVSVLYELGHDVDTVAGEHLIGQDDRLVWISSQDSGRFLITQDLDFSDIRRYAPGTHHGLLLVRLARPGRNELFDRVQGLFASEDVAGWVGCLVIATDPLSALQGLPTSETRIANKARTTRRSAPIVVSVFVRAKALALHR